MTLLERIPEGVIVAVDTAPWVYVLDRHSVYAPILQPLFDDRFAAGLDRAGASVLVLGELLVQPIALGRTDIADDYRRFFNDPTRVTTWAIDQAVADRAAELRAKHGLKMIDALHAASAIHYGAAVFLTNDLGLRRVTEIPVIILDDFLPPSP